MKKILSAVIMTAMLASFCACEVTVKPDAGSDTATTTVSNNGASDGDVPNNGAEVTETAETTTEATTVTTTEATTVTTTKATTTEPALPDNIVTIMAKGTTDRPIARLGLPKGVTVVSGNNTDYIELKSEQYPTMKIEVIPGLNEKAMYLGTHKMTYDNDITNDVEDKDFTGSLPFTDNRFGEPSDWKPCIGYTNGFMCRPPSEKEFHSYNAGLTPRKIPPRPSDTEWTEVWYVNYQLPAEDTFTIRLTYDSSFAPADKEKMPDYKFDMDYLTAVRQAERFINSFGYEFLTLKK